MIDVHAHLTAAEFAEDLEEVLERARVAGVEMVLTAGEDYEDNLKVLSLAKRYPMVKACLGHHPANLDRSTAESTLSLISNNIDGIAGIGEVGLDFWRAKEPAERRTQEEIFGIFLEIAKANTIPPIVHSRSAGKRAIELLIEHGVKSACLHAFDGKASSAERGIQEGYFFSIPPSITRSPQKQKLVSHLPLERLLLETDSPVLGPDRAERNEPSNIISAAVKIAEIKGVSPEEVKRISRENTLSLFTRLRAY